MIFNDGEHGQAHSITIVTDSHFDDLVTFLEKKGVNTNFIPRGLVDSAPILIINDMTNREKIRAMEIQTGEAAVAEATIQ